MKLFNKLSLFTLVLGSLSIFSCQDFEEELGSKLDVSELDFTIVQDYSIDEGGNTIILTNNTPGTIPVWNYGTGRSTRAIDTIHFAFAGDYTIQFSAITDGGVVDAAPVTITVTDDNFNYIQDPLWELISGGVGNSKTWLLDLDEEGVSKYFNGPLYFYGTGDGWETIQLEEEGLGRTAINEQLGLDDSTGWNWNPDWAGNTWIMDAADYGSMTFSLDGGPYLDVEHLTIPILGTQSGTYYLDPEDHTLSTTDAVILHDGGREGCVDAWGDIRIFSLTENTMQLGVLRRDDCDGAAMLVYNFITQEYSDNWEPVVEIPEEDEGFEPSFESGELLNILTGGPAAGRYWRLDGGGNPIDWITNGMGWTTAAADSYNWGWNDDWTATAQESWIRFDQYGGSLNYYKYQDGEESSGTFTINEATNEVTLSDDLTLISTVDNWLNPTSSTFTVIKAIPDDFDTFGLWFGTSYDETNNQWIAFHYMINNNVSGGGGAPVEAEPTAIAVDNSLINFGDLEGNGNVRIEIYNEYGSTGSNPPIDLSSMNFNNSIEVTFTISGTGVTGDYNASIYYADSDWYPSGNGSNTTVSGDGTYTVSFVPGVAGEGCIVFVVDIVGMGADIADLSTVNVTIDEVLIN